MTRRAKIAVTLPQQLVDAARRAVAEGRTSSVSAYVAEALQDRVDSDDIDGVLSHLLQQTGGPLTAAERKWADRALGR